jgi:hypothetical protein
MYHVELRQFPHKHHRFNLGEQQLAEMLVPWVHAQPIELGERKWSPQQATITVLEGPELEISALSMGRGWRSAEREGEDVTARVLASAGERRLEARGPGATGLVPAAPGASPAPASAAGAGAAAADPIAVGVQLASLLGANAGELLYAWREVARENPGLAPSESLALAERRIAPPAGA